MKPAFSPTWQNMTLTVCGVLFSWFVVPEGLSAECEVEPETINLYIAPNGRPAAKGTCDEPLSSFADVQQMLAGKLPMNVTVHAAHGKYARETVIWTTTAPDRIVKFLCPPGGRCVMDGEHATSVFFVLPVARGQCTNVVIDGFTIERYINWGVRFSGGGVRDHDKRDSTWNGCNRVVNNVFQQIGSRWGCADTFGGKCRGYGMVTTQNSDRNLVESNRFLQGLNAPKPSGIHAVYLANGSSDNTIRNNYAERISSAMFKTRDDSSRNRFINNTCIDGPLCFYSGMPGSRMERQDRGIVLRDFRLIDVDQFYECRIRPSGDRSKKNCRDVIIDQGQIRLARVPVRDDDDDD